MKIFFIRTPRYIWPFYSRDSSFWQPLGFASLAAACRKEFPNLQIKIIDCPILTMGWKSLSEVLTDEKPDVVCIGEETVSSPQGLRLAHLAKAINPDCINIAGGHFFTYMIKETLTRHPIDFIVKYEGEETLLELLREIEGGARTFNHIKGIAFSDDGRIVETPPRPLLQNLDELPFPAYDLLPMNLYGRRSRNHPHLVSVEHSRGCTDRCEFCILWQHMADRTCGEPIPKYRSKSPERCFEEVKYLAKKYDRKTFAWVDPTWNLDPAWCDRFSRLILRSGLKIQFTAWMRADGVVRDEKLGILEKEVKAGLVQAMIGVERIRPKDLKALNKHNNSGAITAEAFSILRSKYPSVYTIGTMIYGLWDDTKSSLDELLSYDHKTGMDYGFFIPLTPTPGTKIWQEAKEKGRLAATDFSAYNFHTPVMRTRALSRRSLENFYLMILLKCSLARLRRMLHFCFFETNKRKRQVHCALVRHGLYVVFRYLYNRLLHPFCDKLSLGCQRPRWYNS